MSAEETEPAVIHDFPGVRPEMPWQHASDVAWSFGVRSRRLFSSGNAHLRPPDITLPQRNSQSTGTVGPQRVKVPDLATVAPPDRRLGHKALQALSHWEGVVEDVEGDMFRARLTPLVAGRPDYTRAEFAEFGFDELAYEADRSLIERDAVVYWTVGRRRDEAGTVSNQSLVRVRRKAPPSAVRRRLAAEEVAALLAEAEEQE